jgi:hypothetical protein
MHESQHSSKEKTSINIVFSDGPRILPSSFQGSMGGVLRAGKESQRCGERHRKMGEKRKRSSGRRLAMASTDRRYS